ncbi:MAG: orotate phosphoribosyltransferase [Clostridia bacterium]|nr:orotate phosphoribosyltransferase [Clostridia bacterium]
MENRKKIIRASSNRNITLEIIPGHFATNHSHINYFVDLTTLKSQFRSAKAAAEELASRFATKTPVDTIVCLEGTEMVGAFLAEELARPGSLSLSQGADIAVLTPETNANNQMLFRDNMQKMVWNKNILLLISSASTGKTIIRSMECLKYYNGRLAGVAALFSAEPQVAGVNVEAIFTANDLPGYINSLSGDCPMCRNGQKIDAIVNSFGYSKI